MSHDGRPRSASMRFAAAARSGPVSIKVPSRSIMTIFTDSGKGIGAGRGDLADVVHLHAAVNLEADRTPAGVDELAHLAQLVERRADETLAAETRVHRHEQNHVHFIHHVL